MTLAILVLVGLWLSHGMVSCGSGESGTSELDPEISDLVRYYQEMKAVGLNGMVERFVAMRDSVTTALVDTYFTLQGWVLDSAKVSQWAYNWPDVAGLPLVQDSIQGRWRRLIFRQCGMFDEAGRETCMFSVIIFARSGDRWKVSNATRSAAFRYDPDGTEHTVGELMFHGMFQLPPSYDHLKPPEPNEGTPPMSQPRRIQRDPQTGKILTPPPGDSS